jgi:hypothetical protein
MPQLPFLATSLTPRLCHSGAASWTAHNTELLLCMYYMSSRPEPQPQQYISLPMCFMASSSRPDFSSSNCGCVEQQAWTQQDTFLQVSAVTTGSCPGILQGVWQNDRPQLPGTTVSGEMRYHWPSAAVLCLSFLGCNVQNQQRLLFALLDIHDRLPTRENITGTYILCSQCRCLLCCICICQYLSYHGASYSTAPGRLQL